MKFEGYNPTPEEVQNAEQMMTPEQRLASDLREKVLTENFEAPEAINEQSENELKKCIEDIANIFSKSQRPWFMGGGIALELHNDRFQRNHGDYDVFVYKEDIDKFIEPIRESGYEFFHITPGKKDVIATEAQITIEGNFHLKKMDERTPGPEYIDLTILWREGNTGNIIWGQGGNIILPRNLFENLPTYTSINGRKIALASKEVLTLNKIFGARQLDFHDLKIFLPTLTVDERQRVNMLVEAIGATFIIAGRETQNLDELLQLVEAQTKEAKENFLAPKVDEIVSKNSKIFNTFFGQIFEISNRTNSTKNFLDEIKRGFGKNMEEQNILAGQRILLEEIAKFLFRDRRPTLEEFREFAHNVFNISQYLERALKNEAWVMPRWKIRAKNENVGK